MQGSTLHAFLKLLTTLPYIYLSFSAKTIRDIVHGTIFHTIVRSFRLVHRTEKVSVPEVASVMCPGACEQNDLYCSYTHRVYDTIV